MGRDDVIVATLGLVLAFTCALFPWYIFFNQEKFGVREFVFSGGREGSFAKTSTALLHPSMEPFSPSELPLMELDFFPTATTVPATSKQPRIVPASQQPFPADLVSYRLVHVANGRAMIEDDDGLWVVQRGSQLPDASHVTAIERRSGEWVLVTTTDKVIKLSR